MKKSTIAVVALAVALAAGPVSAQEMALGTWTGTMTPPGAQPVPVSYQVSRAGDALAIVMTSDEVEGEMPFQDVMFDGQVLVFWWDPGVRVDCALRWTDEGALQGTCTDGRAEDGQGAMVMTPPGDGGGQLRK